jgi:hypothetical protein
MLLYSERLVYMQTLFINNIFFLLPLGAIVMKSRRRLYERHVLLIYFFGVPFVPKAVFFKKGGLDIVFLGWISIRCRYGEHWRRLVSVNKIIQGARLAQWPGSTAEYLMAHWLPSQTHCLPPPRGYGSIYIREYAAFFSFLLVFFSVS